MSRPDKLNNIKDINNKNTNGIDTNGKQVDKAEVLKDGYVSGDYHTSSSSHQFHKKNTD